MTIPPDTNVFPIKPSHYWPGGIPASVRFQPESEIPTEQFIEDTKGWIFFLSENWVTLEAAGITGDPSDYEFRQRRELIVRWAEAEQTFRDIRPGGLQRWCLMIDQSNLDEGTMSAVEYGHNGALKEEVRFRPFWIENILIRLSNSGFEDLNDNLFGCVNMNGTVLEMLERYPLCWEVTSSSEVMTTLNLKPKAVPHVTGGVYEDTKVRVLVRAYQYDQWSLKGAPL
ncbi:hypothetical protein N7478_000228 [Penicillium angulare]|uniref:uncharacterized protein n=1 Tax=Penicillium angulare TaxID=116970 RepID=UPI0025408ABD|nr:uncharacterized protein N7478_000228 [Penicillium angulare]KAJ5290977.1 hypothetical protein N7478_000228 [Penicillium angulare]